MRRELVSVEGGSASLPKGLRTLLRKSGRLSLNHRAMTQSLVANGGERCRAAPAHFCGKLLGVAVIMIHIFRFTSLLPLPLICRRFAAFCSVLADRGRIA